VRTGSGPPGRSRPAPVPGLGAGDPAPPRPPGLPAGGSPAGRRNADCPRSGATSGRTGHSATGSTQGSRSSPGAGRLVPLRRADQSRRS
jgi:hypothetical protein